MAVLKRMIRYLIGVRQQSVRMEPTNAEGIDVYADSNWAGSADRKYVDCNVVKLWGMVLVTSTKQQSFVAQSSAEAELAGGHRATMAALCVKNFLAEVSLMAVPATVWMDSKAGLAMLARVGVGRVRHLEVKQLFCQHIAASGKIQYRKVKGSANPADAGTKAFSDVTHFTHPLQIVDDSETLRHSQGVQHQGHESQDAGLQTKGLLATLASCLLKVARAEKMAEESSSYDWCVPVFVMGVLFILTMLVCNFMSKGIRGVRIQRSENQRSENQRNESENQRSENQRSENENQRSENQRSENENQRSENQRSENQRSENQR
eukprot:4322780-Amphidinium_carterae.1